MLPLVRATFEDVRPMHERMQRRAVQLVELSQELQLGMQSIGALPSDVIKRRAELHELALDIHKRLGRIRDLGVEVKGVDGLADFRSLYQGRVVYLCWHWDEPEIRWFHELDGGFRGRQAIGDPALFGGDPVN